jgi:hypothetical protein
VTCSGGELSLLGNGSAPPEHATIIIKITVCKPIIIIGNNLYKCCVNLNTVV